MIFENYCYSKDYQMDIKRALTPKKHQATRLVRAGSRGSRQPSDIESGTRILSPLLAFFFPYGSIRFDVRSDRREPSFVRLRSESNGR